MFPTFHLIPAFTERGAVWFDAVLTWCEIIKYIENYGYTTMPDYKPDVQNDWKRYIGKNYFHSHFI